MAGSENWSAPNGVGGKERHSGGAGEAQASSVEESAARDRDASEVYGIDGGATTPPGLQGLSFPGPIAEAFYFDDSAVVGIAGPVGSGKTTTLLYSRARRALMVPRSTIDGKRRYRLVVVRQTYRQLWSTTIPSYLEVFPKSLGTWSGGRGDPVRHIFPLNDEFGEVEVEVWFMAFGDDIASAMRGIQATDFWLNEADTVPVEVLTLAIGRIDRYPDRVHFRGYSNDLRSYGQIVCDQNAPDEDNWTFRTLYDDEERKRVGDEMTAQLPEGAKPIRITFYRQPGYGEPGAENLDNLPPTYYPQQIAAMKLAGRGDMIDRMVRNKVTYLRVGDPVFRREFTRSIHVAEESIPPDMSLPIRIGLDQGFLAAAVIAQFSPPYHWTILAELMFPSERLMAREFGRRLADLIEDRFPECRIEGGWGDMAGEQGSSQAADETQTWNGLVSAVAGFSIRPQMIGANRVQPRLEQVRAALEFLHGGAPGLKIDPSCKRLIAGLEARYVWTDQVDASGDRRKTPDKRIVEANVVDALQYLLLSEAKPDGTSPVSSGVHGVRRRPQQSQALRVVHDVLRPYG